MKYANYNFFNERINQYKITKKRPITENNFLVIDPSILAISPI
jgi:hypothetical protein